MSKASRYLTVYGATGFTGTLVAHYLDTHPELQDKQWAIAGRTQAKLDKLVAALKSEPKVFCVDLENSDAVNEMVKKSSVILNCAGPYAANNGAALLGACAREGVHYSDLAGEGFWQAEMVEAFHETACESGAKIILGGGVDSIPSDLGAYIARKAIQDQVDGQINIRAVYTKYTGSFSGGTLNSGKVSVQARKSGRFTDVMANNPYVLTPGITGIETTDSSTADGMPRKFKRALDLRYGMVHKFFMAPINARVVRRSYALREEHINTTYSECASLGMWVRLFLMYAISGFGYFLGQPINFKPKSGEGPPPWLLRSGGFKIELMATSNSKRAKINISGKGDPGYGATSKMLAELGLSLALDDHSASSHKAGILTPSTGLGDLLIHRLSKAKKGGFMKFRTAVSSN